MYFHKQMSSLDGVVMEELTLAQLDPNPTETDPVCTSVAQLPSAQANPLINWRGRPAKWVWVIYNFSKQATSISSMKGQTAEKC